jgi:hypothetical protein
MGRKEISNGSQGRNGTAGSMQMYGRVCRPFNRVFRVLWGRMIMQGLAIIDGW